jgi:hypothetical protein
MVFEWCPPRFPVKHTLALSLFLLGCADIVPTPASQPIETKIASSALMVAAPQLKSTLLLPARQCEFFSIARADLPATTPSESPTIIEKFQDGCPTELWVNRYEGTELSLSAYIPWVQPPTFGRAVPWVETYSKEGLTETIERRETFEGALVSRIFVEKNDEGNAVLYEVSKGGVTHSNGVVASIETVRVNSDGDPIERILESDGGKKVVEKWEYLAGRLVNHYEYKNDEIITTDVVWRKDGSRMEAIVRPGFWTKVREIDSQGRLFSESQDHDNDGVVETRITNSYDALGNSIRETDKGVSDIRRKYSGKRILEEIKTYGDELTQTHFVYFEDGSFESNTVSAFKDGEKRREIKRVNGNGHVIYASEDIGDDGVLERLEERTFDGPRILTEKITKGDRYSMVEWVYDAQHRVLLEAHDADADGRAESGTQYRYDVDGLDDYRTLKAPVL